MLTQEQAHKIGRELIKNEKMYSMQAAKQIVKKYGGVESVKYKDKSLSPVSIHKVILYGPGGNPKNVGIDTGITFKRKPIEVKENNSIRNYDDFDYSQMQATKAENARLKAIIKKLLGKTDRQQLIELLLEK